MARLEIEIGGSDRGGNAELQETLGLLEKLALMKKGLTVDLFKAETIDGIKAVGENLTGVNVKIAEYLGLASKATQAWQDDRTNTVLDNLALKLTIIRTNVKAFGDSIRSQSAELRAYQTAFDQLIANGLDRTDTEVISLEGKIRSLTGAIDAQKASIAQQGAYDKLATKLQQITNNVGLMGNALAIGKESVKAYQSAIDNLIKAGLDPADAEITRMKEAIRGLQEQMARDTAKNLKDSFRDTGFVVQDAQNKIARLKNMLNFATTEAQVARLNSKLADAQKELKRLGEVGLTSQQLMGRFSSQANSVGVEFARIIQDAPYASKALGAMQDNFGAIGNNITRLTELLPQYTAQIQANLIATGKSATATQVLKMSLLSMVSGANGLILAISILTSLYTVYTALSARKQRELEKEKEKVKSLAEQTDKLISSMDAETKLRIEAAAAYTRESAMLESLNATVMSATSTKEQQAKAYEQLQKMYPAELSGLSQLEYQADKTSAAYKGLVANMKQLALAEAANRLSAKAAEDNVKATMALEKAKRDLVGLEGDLANTTKKAYEDMKKYGAIGVDGIVSAAAAAEGRIKASIESQKRDIATLAEAAKVAGKEHEVYFDAAIKANGSIKEQTGLIRDLEKQMRALEAAKPFLKTEAEIAANVAQTKVLQKELDRLNGKETKGSRLAKVGTDAAKSIASVRVLGEAISKIYDPTSDSGNLKGLQALEKLNQATENKYKELADKVNEVERKKLEDYQAMLVQKPKAEAKINAQIRQLAVDAANERKEIELGRQRELDANRVQFAEETASKIAELEARAGKQRIASRESELAQDRLYWDEVAKSAKLYNITAEQLTEWRKSSEAAITAKWDQKMIETSFIYQRRSQEDQTQLMIRHLNKRTELQLKAVQGDKDKALAIQREYFAELATIQSRDNQLDFLSKFDGSAFSLMLEDINTKMANLRNQTGSSREEMIGFAQSMEQLRLQADVVGLLSQQFDTLASSIGTNLTDAIFEGKSLAESFQETFKSMTKTIIAELIKIGIRYAINQAIGVSSMAATVAASSAAAKAVASAWATAAALSSIATFGASAAAGGAALAAVVASSKALALAGFKSGGYTGNVGRNRIAGIVHGREFVMNATATKENMPVLKAMNAGRDFRPLMKDRPADSRMSSLGSVAAPVAQTINITGAISGDVIRVTNDRSGAYTKKFGRG